MGFKQVLRLSLSRKELPGKIGGAGLDVVAGEDSYFHSDWSSKVDARLLIDDRCSTRDAKHGLERPHLLQQRGRHLSPGGELYFIPFHVSM